MSIYSAIAASVMGIAFYCLLVLMWKRMLDGAQPLDDE